MDISQVQFHFPIKYFKCNTFSIDCFVTNWLHICTLESYYVQRMVQQCKIDLFKRQKLYYVVEYLYKNFWKCI